jgi:hypothetical protein
MIMNRPTADLPADLRNFDAFYVGCNHLQQMAEAAE